MAHPVEIGLQKRLIDLLSRCGIQNPRLTKIVCKTIYRVADSTDMTFPQGAQQRICLEKPADIFPVKNPAKVAVPTGQMLVKVGYVREVLPDCKATESMSHQPTTETLHKIH